MFVFPKGHVYPIGARGFFLTQFMYFKKGNFAQKRVLKLVEPFSGHCLATNSRLQVRTYRASWSGKRLASKVRACAECKISRFSLFRPSFAFLASSFVSSFVGQLVATFHWQAFFEKLLDLRIRCKVGTGTRFSWVFSGQCDIFFLPFSRTSLYWIFDRLNWWLLKQYKGRGSARVLTYAFGANGLNSELDGDHTNLWRSLVLQGV